MHDSSQLKIHLYLIIILQIHLKKRSRHEHQKLQDLVYIRYNQALKERFDFHDVMDLILINDNNDINEWLVEKMSGDVEDVEDDLEFNDDTLTWGDVASVTGAGEPLNDLNLQSSI